MTTSDPLPPKKRPDKLLLRALRGQATEQTPIWLMRQAGRYLPEYRALREQAGSFMNLCFNPEHAAEVTLQPLQRFDLDAAIIFSDILVVPYALGLPLHFAEGEGPQLKAVPTPADWQALNFADQETFRKKLLPVYEAITRTRTALDPEKALIGFAGAPWTLACYMIDGRGGRGFPATVKAAAENPDHFTQLIDNLTAVVSDHLLLQIEAGADAVQIFDSWAGLVPQDHFTRWVIEPARRISEAVRRYYPHVPVIGFPRGAGENYATYAAQAQVNALGVDQSADIAALADDVHDKLCLQGNLSPDDLLAGGLVMKNAALQLLEKMKDRPYVFNLGHGVIKETPPQHVADLVNLVKSFT